MKFFLIFLSFSVAQAKPFNSKRSFQFDFPDNEKISYAKLVGTIDHELQDYTLCHWSRFNVITNTYAGVFSYKVQEYVKGILTFVQQSKNVRFYQLNFYDSDTPLMSPPTDWFHICVIWSAVTDRRQIFVNGVKIRNFISDNKKTLPPNGVVILGQIQTAPLSQSFIGQISEVNLWDFVLTPNEVEQVFKCEFEEEGNIIGWHRSKWELVNGTMISPVHLPCGQPQS